MRTFTLGQGAQRKFVVIDLQGVRMAVTHGKPDAAPTRQEKTLASEAEARKAADLMVKELLARGFVEQTSSGPKVHPSVKTPPAAKAASASRVGAAVAPGTAKPAKPTPPPAPDPDMISYDLLEEDEDEAVPAAPLARIAPPPKSAEPEAARPKKKKGKKKKGSNPDGLDRRVIYAVGAIGLGFVALAGWLTWDVFFKPPTLVATWKGNRTEHETGGPISYSTYVLILDEQKRAAFAVNDEKPEMGTYEMKDGRLLLHLKDGEGDPSEVVFKASLGRGSLDLFDVESGQKVVQLLRTFEKPVVAAGPAAPAAPTGVAGPGGDVNAPADAAADAALASVDYAAKDGAFRLKAPPGWEMKDGARPDNTYSWVRFEQGSAKIEVRADVSGSLMTGAPADGQYEEGSEFAPVQNAHELYKQTVKEEYSDLAESEPTLFKNAGAGEGRISSFTAAGGGLFGGKTLGYRVTFLTNNRRVTVLCDAPQKEFAGLKPTFLAVCRSLAR
jgi:predicted DNA-binding WGR domain protein